MRQTRRIVAGQKAGGEMGIGSMYIYDGERMDVRDGESNIVSNYTVSARACQSAPKIAGSTSACTAGVPDTPLSAGAALPASVVIREPTVGRTTG